MQYTGSTSNNSVIAFNTVTSGEEGIQLAAQNGSTLTNSTVDNNVIIAGPLIQGSQGLQVQMSYSIAVQQLPGNTINGVVVDDNYVNSSNAFGPFYTPTGSNIAFSGNLDMTSDAQIASPAGVTSSDVSSVTVSPANGTAAAGSTITISLNMDRVMSVSGIPTLSLSNGGTATYQSGSGTNVLTFTYPVGSLATPIASLAVTAVNLTGGATVTDSFGNEANLSGALVTFTDPVVSAAGQARVLLWNNSNPSDFSNVLNWTDRTSGTPQPATAPPTSVDTVDFFGNGSAITGTGTAGSMTFDSTGGGAWQMESAAIVSVAGTVTVGFASANELIIGGASTLIEGDSAVIANTVLASGSSAEVTGAGSNWQIAGALIVGDAGFGSLSISQCGTVDAISAAEATAAGGDGVITVSGTGSALNLSGSLTVGDQAAGEVSVLSGATVTALDVTIGSASAASSGNVDVEGLGSSLHILNGGILNIGVAGGGSGILTIGTNATLSFNGTIVEAGHASFNNNGGVVNSDAAVLTTASNAGVGLNEYDLHVDNLGAVQVVGGIGVWDAPMLLTGTSVSNAVSNINRGKLGQWQLSNGGTLVINANTVDAGQVIVFEDNTDTLVIGQVVNGGQSGQTPTVLAGAENLLQAGGFHAAIWGYEAGDQILFNNLAVASDQIVNGNTLELLGVGNTDLGSLTFMTEAGNKPLDATTMAAAAMQLASQVIQIDNTTTLIAIHNDYVLEGSGSSGPTLQYLGNPVTAGEFGAYTPIGAAALTADGYEVALKNTATGLITVWDTDANGNFTGSPTGGPVSGTNPLLEELEPSFNQDLNNDGTIGLKPGQVIQIDNTTTLISVGNEYVMEGSGGSGPTLQYLGNPVTAGEFGAYTPIGAAALTAGGYEVALKNTATGLITVWDTDANGNFTGSPTGGPLSGTNPVLEELEPSFNQDLNNDGTIGLKAGQVIQIDNATTLMAVGNEYVLEGSGGSGPILQYLGSPVTAGEFGAYTPIGAAALTGGGYEIALKNTATGLITVWDTDANGNFTGSPSGGPVSGTNPVLEELELSFHQDLNNDGTIGLKPGQVIQIDNATTLIAVGNEYVMEGSGGSGPILQYLGSPVTAGEFGAYAPIGAASITGGGFEVALKNTATGLITVWDTDANGNFSGSPTGGPVSGTNPVLEELEPSFNQDLNNDGTIGLKPGQVIQIDNATTLMAVGNEYVLEGSGGSGPILQYLGSPVTVGEFGAYTPIGAAALTGVGYEIALKNTATGLITVWDTDVNGNFTGSPTGGPVSGANPVLEELELSFHQDLNNDGTIGLKPSQVIQIDNTTTLIAVGNEYVMEGSGGSGPILQYLGSPVTAGEFGAYTPIGAAALTGGGYEVALKNTATGLITVWDTDVNGNFTGSPTGGPVSGANPVLEELELSFHQDLNNDGTIGLKPSQVIQVDNATTLIAVGNEYVMEGSGGSGPILQYLGSPVTAGEFGAYTPIGAAAITGSGYEVALKNTATGLITVWDTDASGNFTGSPSGGPVSGASPLLEELELSFHQDLNNDGTIGLKPGQVIQIDNTTTLIAVGNEYVIEGSGGSGPILQYGDNPVTAGEFGGWTPIGAVQQSGGDLVAWKMAGQDQYRRLEHRQ